MESSHIDSFPVLESHYCKAKTNKKYLEEGLTKENASEKTSLGSNLLTTITSLMYVIIFIFTFQNRLMWKMRGDQD